MESKEDAVDVEAKVKAEEEVAILDDEGVNQTTKIHNNLQWFILTLLPKVYYIRMKIGSSSVANSVLQCTKRRSKMDGLIATLHHQDSDSMTKYKYKLLSTRSSSLPLEHKYMRLTLEKKWLFLYNFHLLHNNGALQFLQ